MCHSLSGVSQNTSNIVTDQTSRDSMSNLTRLIKLGNGGERGHVQLTCSLMKNGEKAPILLHFSEIISNMLI